MTINQPTISFSDHFTRPRRTSRRRPRQFRPGGFGLEARMLLAADYFLDFGPAPDFMDGPVLYDLNDEWDRAGDEDTTESDSSDSDASK